MRKILGLMIIGILTACGDSVQELKGKWVDENGGYYFINTAGDNKIILNGEDELLFPNIVMLQSESDENNYSLVDGTHPRMLFFYEVIVEDKDNLRLHRRVTEKITGLEEGPDIEHVLTRVNQ